jgi:glycosyltransferase involved in cell wall biosynthesis
MTGGDGRRRVLVVATWYPTSSAPLGGTFVAEQVRTLEARFDVAVIAPDWRRPRRLLARPVRAVTPAPGDPYRPIARCWVPRSPRLAGSAYEAAVERAYGRIVQETGRPDVIHAHVAYPGGFAAAKIGERHGIPVVLTEHAGPFSMLFTSPFTAEAIRWTLSRVSRILAVGPSLRAEILQVVPDRQVDVVGNVIDTAFFTPGEQAETQRRPPMGRPLRIATVGSSAPLKGVDVLLEAVHMLTAAGVAVELVVAGDSPERASLEGESRRLDIDDRCRFVGHVSRSDVREYLRWCDLYVSASRHESFGVSIAEALACERPVVVTRSGGPESFVEPEFGLIVEKDDPTALADAIRRFASGAICLDGAVGRKRIAERFGRDAFLESITRIYDDLVAGAGRAGTPEGRS